MKYQDISIQNKSSKKEESPQIPNPNIFISYSYQIEVFLEKNSPPNPEKPPFCPKTSLEVEFQFPAKSEVRGRNKKMWKKSVLKIILYIIYIYIYIGYGPLPVTVESEG